MKRYLPFVIVSAVALITLAGGTMLYHAKGGPLLTMSKNRLTLGTGGAESIHIRGQPDAPVTLEEFGDFECPPCGKLSEPINKLEQDYHSRLRIIFHHFPLAAHLHAREAALAAEAAGLQGRFWEMHDVLYREQSTWSKAADVRPLLDAYAGMLRLKIDRFKKDMESDEVKRRVNADQEQGANLGVKVTPTIFINNRALPPASLNEAGLHEAIEAAIKAKR
jgi:formate-nitrite transporter family protein